MDKAVQQKWLTYAFALAPDRILDAMSLVLLLADTSGNYRHVETFTKTCMELNIALYTGSPNLIFK